jgi:hypothetical protein
MVNNADRSLFILSFCILKSVDAENKVDDIIRDPIENDMTIKFHGSVEGISQTQGRKLLSLFIVEFIIPF